MFHKIIAITQIITAFALIVLVLLQQKGGGLSGFLGGTGGNYMKRRGFEKYLHVFTIILISIFLATSILIFVF